MEYIVQIKMYTTDDDDVMIKELGPFNSERQAAKCDDGVNINLNHEDYYTLIIENPDTIKGE